MVSGGYVLNLVIEGGMKCRGFFLRPRSYSSGQVSAPGSLFQDEELRGMLQFLPQRVELSPHTVGEEGGDIRRGEEVALPTHRCGAGQIVAIAGVVERHTHVFGEGERSLALNALANQLMQCRKRHVSIFRSFPIHMIQHIQPYNRCALPLLPTASGLSTGLAFFALTAILQMILVQNILMQVILEERMDTALASGSAPDFLKLLAHDLRWKI